MSKSAHKFAHARIENGIPHMCGEIRTVGNTGLNFEFDTSSSNPMTNRNDGTTWRHTTTNRKTTSRVRVCVCVCVCVCMRTAETYDYHHHARLRRDVRRTYEQMWGVAVWGEQKNWKRNGGSKDRDDEDENKLKDKLDATKWLGERWRTKTTTRHASLNRLQRLQRR